MPSELLTERRGTTLVLTISDPATRNTLSAQVIAAAIEALGVAESDPEVRCVVLQGAGGHFCAGGDLDAMAVVPPAPANGGPDPLVAAYRQFGDALMSLNSLPQATVAIVEGSAVGGGVGMACCSDVVILHDSARFGMPEPKVGFIPSQIIPFVVRQIGEGPARDLAVTGRVIDAAEARRLGIGSHLCAGTADINRTLRAVLDDILRLEPQAVATVKRLVLGCATSEDGAVLDDAAESLVGLLRRPQASEGIKAFMAKTAPSWAKE